MANRVAGTIEFKINGVVRQAKGEFSYNIGVPKRTAMMGTDKLHGFKEEPQVGFIEGAITDQENLTLAELVSMTNETIVLELANGKTISAGGAYYAHEGTVKSNDAEIPIRFESGTMSEF